MVFLKVIDDCLCGVIDRVLRRQPAKLSLLGITEFVKYPMPPPALPLSKELPVKIAAAMRADSCSGPRRCGVAGVAGPIIAVILGAADGLGMDEGGRATLHLALRRELRQLARVLGAAAATETRTVAAASIVNLRTRSDAFDILISWSQTPGMPTYSVGVHLVLGDADEASREVAEELAWVFRLLCARARINANKEAPMLSSVCEILCASKGEAAGATTSFASTIQKVMIQGRKLNRRVSFPAECFIEQEDLDLAWTRFNSEDVVGPFGRSATTVDVESVAPD